MALNISRLFSTQVSQAKSAAVSSGYAVDAPESAAISTAMSTAGAGGVISTADSTVKAAVITVASSALSVSIAAGAVSEADSTVKGYAAAWYNAASAYLATVNTNSHASAVSAALSVNAPIGGFISAIISGVSSAAGKTV